MISIFMILSSRLIKESEFHGRPADTLLEYLWFQSVVIVDRKSASGSLKPGLWLASYISNRTLQSSKFYIRHTGTTTIKQPCQIYNEANFLESQRTHYFENCNDSNYCGRPETS